MITFLRDSISLRVVMNRRKQRILSLYFYEFHRNCCLKVRTNAHNVVGQQDATLLGPTCCERLDTMLCVVATCWKLLDEVLNWSNFRANKCHISTVSPSSKRGPTLLRSFAQHIQQCCAGARALHATCPHKYMRTRNQHSVGDGKRPRVLCILI